jgi:hypothetical protein
MASAADAKRASVLAHNIAVRTDLRILSPFLGNEIAGSILQPARRSRSEMTAPPALALVSTLAK